MLNKTARWIFAAFGCLALTLCAQARTSPNSSKIGPVREIGGNPALDDYMLMDVGNIWSAISNFGNYGDPNANLPSGQWPAGSDNNYIWEGRFWVASLVQGKKRVSHADYGDYEFHSSGPPLDPFSLGPGISIQDSRVAFDDFAATTTHTPLNLQIIQTALTWSMPDYDDFIAIQYKVINASSTTTLSNLYVAWVFDNDVASLDATEPHIDDNVDYDGWDGPDTDTDLQDWVDPQDLDNDGLDGYDDWGIPYGWTNSDNPNANPSLIEPDGVYDEYQIFLDPAGPEILAQTGPNAGLPLMDQETNQALHGYLISRNMSMIYDGDNNAVTGNDTGERGLPTPCDGWTGGRLIYTPHEPYYTAPEDTFPRPFAHQWWNWNSDPGNDDEKYDYMTASHAASLGYHFIPNPKEIGAPTFDYRWLTSTGPFMLGPQDTLRFVYAFCIAQGLKGVRGAADQAMKAYYQGSMNSNPGSQSDPEADAHWVLPVPPPIPNLNYTGINGGIRLAWDNHAETTPDPTLGLPDFEGYKVYRAAYAPANWELIFACDNRPNRYVYVVSTEGDTLNPRNGNDSIEVMIDSTATWVHPLVPIDVPDVTHAFTDTGGSVLAEGAVDTSEYDINALIFSSYEPPLNNVPYYYALVAYDSLKPATETSPELASQESARSNYLKNPSSGAPLPVYPQSFNGGPEDQGASGDSSGIMSNYTDVQHIKVVPNPYRGTNTFEARYESIIRFINLPPACKITILTIAGDVVRVLDHDSGGDTESWDLLSKNIQSVVSGLYLFVAETTSDKKIGKFVIAR